MSDMNNDNLNDELDEVTGGARRYRPKYREYKATNK